MYLGGHQIYVPRNIDNCRITNVVLDGNVSNWTLTNWAVGTGIYIDANNNTLVDHCRLNNQIGDALETDDCVNAVLFACDVENCAGRGFSFGGSGVDLGTKLLACRFYNCETNANAYLSPGGGGSNDGHGSINFSLGGKDSLIEGCQIDTGITGIGSLGHVSQSGASIANNVIRNATSYAIEGIGKGGNTPATNVTITGNRIYNSVRVYLNEGAASSGAVEWEISNNLFVETDLWVNNYQQVGIRGNRFYSAGTAMQFLTLSNSGGTVGVQNSVVSNNRFYGGANAIVCGQYDTGLVITGNICSNQTTYGINTGAAGPNVSVNNNVILVGPATTSGMNGIAINGQVEVRNNIVDLGTTAGIGNNGIQVGSATSKARIIGNTVTTRSVVAPIAIIAGASLVELRDNMTNWPYSDAGTNTIKTGNRTDTHALSGRAVLVAGTKTISDTEVRTADNIILTRVVAGGTLGNLSIGTIVDKTSFDINSDNAADISTIYWKIDH